MSEHTRYADLLPLYVSGHLDGSERRAVQQHLRDCPECQSDLALWTAVAGEVVTADRELAAPPALPVLALAGVRPTRRQPREIGGAIQLLRSQLPLVRREIWPASAAIMALGIIAGVIAGDTGIIQMLAPLAAAASIAVIYGPQNDPALELTLATPTSPWQVLLARVVLVFGYNLALALVGSLVLFPSAPAGLFGSLVLGWLGPMTFLSMAALSLSLWIGTANAVTVAYLAWLARLLSLGSLHYQGMPLRLEFVGLFLSAYERFWSSPLALLVLSVPLLAFALWCAGRQERSLADWA